MANKQAKKALEQFKMEAANEVGVNLHLELLKRLLCLLVCHFVLLRPRLAIGRHPLSTRGQRRALSIFKSARLFTLPRALVRSEYIVCGKQNFMIGNFYGEFLR